MAGYSSNSYLAAYGTEMTYNAEFICAFFYNKGWTKNSIAAMLGNMQRESTINPGIWQNLDAGNTSLGIGLVQWTPATKLIDWCNQQGVPYDVLDFQCARIQWELENNVQWIPTTQFPQSFTEFAQSTASVDYLTEMFLKNYERAGVSALAERINHANHWFNHLSDNTGGGNSGNTEEYQNYLKIQSAIAWAVNIANDDSHGYDQTSRWGPDYDCSSLVIQAFEQAGVPVKTNGASYTGNMVDVFKNTGFVDVTSQIDLSTGNGLIAGDVVWIDGHTELIIGNGQICGARINENGETTGGQTGDQTGQEIRVRAYYNYPWTIVLRLPSNSSGGGGDSGGGNSGGGTIETKKKKKRYNFILMNRRKRAKQ